MDGKYIIILLFIFLVFLMGSINSTVTNNFYNNTTGSQDHSVLSNLSYANSNHTGFQASDTLDTDVSALGYVTNEYHDNEKLNKTNGTTDNLFFQDGNYKTFIGKTVAVDFGSWMFESYNAAATAFGFRAQRNGATVTRYYGYSNATTPGLIHRFLLTGARGNISNPEQTVTNNLLQFQFNGAGTGVFNTASASLEVNFSQNGSEGRGATLSFYATPNNGTLTPFLSSNGTYVTFPSLSGTGNDYSCLDSYGTPYRDPTGCS